MASKKPKGPKQKKQQKKPQDHSPSKLLSRHSMKKKKTKKSKNPNHIPLGKNKTLAEKMKNREEEKKKSGEAGRDTVLLSTAPVAEQLRFFLNLFQSANKIKLSPLELEAFKETSMVRLAEDMDQDVENLSEHMKAIFRTSWKEVLCEGKLSEGTNCDAGSPAVLIISTSALRSLELLRGLKPLTRECRPAKLFAKHLKVEEQVASLKSRVNFASGTPSRIKKLIDMDALSLSRLAVVVLDMHRDVKGYSLLTLPQVSAEFWDLYRSHLLQRLLQGDTRICLYGAIPSDQIKKVVKNSE